MKNEIWPARKLSMPEAETTRRTFFDTAYIMLTLPTTLIPLVTLLCFILKYIGCNDLYFMQRILIIQQRKQLLFTPHELMFKIIVT